jgi:penicillin-insensitive murein endopeptidase
MDAMKRRKFLVFVLLWSAWPVVAAESIGAAGNGCLEGAEALAPEGDGYYALRLERGRYYGHPALLRVVRALGAEAKARGWGVLALGDLSQVRGGPMAYGHGSHQNGLDADIRFDLSPLAPEQRENPPETEVVAPGGAEVDPVRWNSAHAALLEAAARIPEVDRLFVHPAIKRELCRTVEGERGWLRKVRPWWGHTAHFHLRLACPADSPACISQAPLPPGEGCGPELDWWFGPEAAPIPKTGAKPALPTRCAKLLAE